MTSQHKQLKGLRMKRETRPVTGGLQVPLISTIFKDKHLENPNEQILLAQRGPVNFWVLV